MEIIQEVSLLIYTLIFIAASTFLEATIWRYENLVKRHEIVMDTWNKHIPMLLVRISMLLPILFISPLLAISLGILIIALHPSSLYYWRNRFNPLTYIKGIWSEPSTSSSATINLKLYQRVILAGIGFSLYIITIIK